MALRVLWIYDVIKTHKLTHYNEFFDQKNIDYEPNYAL